MTDFEGVMGSIEVLKALGNEYNPEILSAAHTPRSAKEFSEILDVPIATCYRRIEELTDADLLEHHDRILTDGQRRTSVYQRNVDLIEVEFNDSSIEVELEERRPVHTKLDNVWRDLSSAN